MNTLMLELGFGNGYAVQGGDIGSKVARVMAATFDSVKAIHSKWARENITEAACSLLVQSILHHARARRD